MVVSHMHLPPHVASRIAVQHHRDLQAQAQRHRHAWELAALARASRRAGRAERRLRRVRRRALQLGSRLEQ
jgi:hypothetical protein